jgi:hypothetical protein
MYGPSHDLRTINLKAYFEEKKMRLQTGAVLALKLRESKIK